MEDDEGLEVEVVCSLDFEPLRLYLVSGVYSQGVHLVPSGPAPEVLSAARRLDLYDGSGATAARVPVP